MAATVLQFLADQFPANDDTTLGMDGVGRGEANLQTIGAAPWLSS